MASHSRFHLLTWARLASTSFKLQLRPFPVPRDSRRVRRSRGLVGPPILSLGLSNATPNPFLPVQSLWRGLFTGGLAAKTHALPEAWVPGCRHSSRGLMIEKCITNSPKFGAREGSFTPILGASSWPSPLLLGRRGPGSSIGQRLHSFHLQESPWRLHPANQKSKVFIRSGRAEQVELLRPGVEGE